MKVFKEKLATAKIDEERRREDRQKKEAEHKMRMDEKQRENELLREQLESQKKEQQSIAMLRQKRLEELNEKWQQGGQSAVATNEATTRDFSGTKGGKRKRKKAKGSDDENDNDKEGREGYDSEEPLDFDADDGEGGGGGGIRRGGDKKKKRKGAAKRTDIDDIFGSDDSNDENDDADADMNANVAVDSSPAGKQGKFDAVTKPVRKLLKRSRQEDTGNASDDDLNDEDQEDDRTDQEILENDSSVIQSNLKNRIVDDD